VEALAIVDEDNVIDDEEPSDEDDQDPAQMTLIFDLALNVKYWPRASRMLVTPGRSGGLHH
jgi:hypothetical protein